ncbi:MAG: oxygen-independent coproporphyrinogen III oxidase [Clostridia bacterium]|nr:oxygen-independent coproporphyrinogen III oxidase [Clostridia bacterium]
MKEVGLYIHIPFCKRKCHYCDFYSICDVDSELIDSYFKTLQQEIEEVGMSSENLIVKTVYIGGGTPSIIDDKYITNIMKTIYSSFKLIDSPEITIEVNPGTVTENKLKSYKDSGINRLSIGMQSANDTLLKEIGRIHSWADFVECYKFAREVGFNNINVDCMIGLPMQTKDDVKNTIKEISILNPEHISVYSLIIEEGTRMEAMVNENKELLPDEDKERAMYWETKRYLESNGYKQYEISNFSKPGYESKHNLDCWHQKEYIGFGPGAHSYTDGIRYSNVSNVKEYIKCYEENRQEDSIIIHEKQDKTAMAKEFIMLSLRTLEGCNKDEFYKKFKYDLEKGFKSEIEKLEKLDLIENTKTHIKLTDKGLDLANIVWEEFV